MWFGKFASLLYIAYLNCERELRDIASLVISMIGGLLFLLIMNELTWEGSTIPIIYFEFALNMVVISMVNLGVIIVLAFQIVISVVFCSSFLRVAYIYDLKSWGSIKTIKDFVFWIENTTKELSVKLYDQLDKDREEKLIKGLMHDKKIELMINKIRE